MSHLGEISHSNSANWELSNDVLVVVVRRKKWHFTPVHTLRQLKRDEGLFPPLRISLASRNMLKNHPRQIFSACVKFGGNLCRDVETVRFYTHTHTHTHTQMKLYITRASHGLSTLRIFLVLRPVLLKNAYFSSPNRKLSKGVRLVELG